MDFVELVEKLYSKPTHILKAVFQDERLYVSDPKSLYHIVLKDQDVYEETAFFIK